MAKISPIQTPRGILYRFRCPGCGEVHQPNQGWMYNGDAERPTFTPSILVTSGHYMQEHKSGDPCWCTYNEQHPDEPSHYKCFRCHSYVTDGKIQFLNDCTNSLAGQTVELPNWTIARNPQ